MTPLELVSPSLSPATPTRRRRQPWRRYGYKNDTEWAMHCWLRTHGYPNAEYEGERNRLVLRHAAGDVEPIILFPDFTLVVDGQRVRVEITNCSWRKLKPPELSDECNQRSQCRALKEFKPADLHQGRLEDKRNRAKEARAIGYGYILIEGKWLRDILQNRREAVRCFHRALRKEAQRARRQAARIQAHEEGRLLLSCKSKPATRQTAKSRQP